MTWRDDALCKGTPVGWWFPTAVAETSVPAITRAYCEACPVWAECRSYALRHEHYGVWAGTSMRQRDRIRAAQRINLVTPGVFPSLLRDPTDDELEEIEREDERTAV